MKIVELKLAAKNKVGHLNKNGIEPQDGEKKTLRYLLRFGFDIELIIPSNTQKVHNPDVLMFGTIWEIKTPTSFNRKTIKKRFSKASKQAHKIVFDLRGVEKRADKVEKQLMELLKGDGDVNRMIIIEKDGRAIDIFK